MRVKTNENHSPHWAMFGFGESHLRIRLIILIKDPITLQHALPLKGIGRHHLISHQSLLMQLLLQAHHDTMGYTGTNSESQFWYFLSHIPSPVSCTSRLWASSVMAHITCSAITKKAHGKIRAMAKTPSPTKSRIVHANASYKWRQFGINSCLKYCLPLHAGQRQFWVKLKDGRPCIFHCFVTARSCIAPISGCSFQVKGSSGSATPYK